MCCSERKAARRAQAFASRQAMLGSTVDTTRLIAAEKASIKASDTMSVVSSPPSYTVATAKHQAGPYDIAPIASISGQTLRGAIVEDSDGFVPASYTPAQQACAHPSRKRRFGTTGIIGGIAFFPWGLFWTFCDSRYECKHCHANLGKYGDGRLDTCGGTSCGRANRAALGMPRKGGCGRARCGHCGRRRCRAGCAGYGAVAY